MGACFSPASSYRRSMTGCCLSRRNRDSSVERLSVLLSAMMNQVILHLCIVIVEQMISFYFIGTVRLPDHKYRLCLFHCAAYFFQQIIFVKNRDMPVLPRTVNRILSPILFPASIEQDLCRILHSLFFFDERDHIIFYIKVVLFLFFSFVNDNRWLPHFTHSIPQYPHLYKH